MLSEKDPRRGRFGATSFRARQITGTRRTILLAMKGRRRFGKKKVVLASGARATGDFVGGGGCVSGGGGGGERTQELGGES